MTVQDDREFVDGVTEAAKQADSNKLYPMKGIVIEIGSGATEGMVRVRRHPHEPVDVGRGFYFVVGTMPALGAECWCQANFATGFVFGDFSAASSAGYETLAEEGTDKPQQPKANFGPGFDVSNNAGASRSDIFLDASEYLATPGNSGFMPGADKTKLDAWWGPQKLGVFATMSGDQVNIASGTTTKVNFDIIQTETPTGVYSTANARYTPTRAGIYHMLAGVLFTPAVASQRVELWLRRNGVNYKLLDLKHTSNTGQIQVAGSFYATANGSTDYFEINLLHTFGVNTSDILAASAESTYWWANYVGSV